MARFFMREEVKQGLNKGNALSFLTLAQKNLSLAPPPSIPRPRATSDDVYAHPYQRSHLKLIFCASIFILLFDEQGRLTSIF